jgi:hypothetical protein
MLLLLPWYRQPWTLGEGEDDADALAEWTDVLALLQSRLGALDRDLDIATYVSLSRSVRVSLRGMHLSLSLCEHACM